MNAVRPVPKNLAAAATTPATTSAVAPATASIPHDPIQNAGFTVLWVYLFLIFSRCTEFVDAANAVHIVLIVALLTGVAAIATGGVLRALASREAFWLIAFTMWLALELPFSSWRGGSFYGFVDSWLKSFATFLLVGGLIASISHCRRAIFSLGLATAVIVFFTMAKGTEHSEDSRLYVTSGTLGNSNDLAIQLLVGLPFCLFVAFDKKRNALVRIFFGAVCAILPVLVLKTGSRGGLLALAAVALMVFLRVSFANKIKLVVATLLLAVIAPAFLPKDVRERYQTIVSGGTPSATATETQASAIESTEARRQLLLQSLELTARNPLFGVGLGQFAQASFELSLKTGQRAIWRETHNFVTLISSETGVPALIFYLGAIVVCFKALWSVIRNSRGFPELDDLSPIAFCLMASLASLIICNMFSTNAYTFHFPLLAGFVAAFERYAKPQIAAAKAAFDPSKVEVKAGNLNWIPARRRPRTPATV